MPKAAPGVLFSLLLVAASPAAAGDSLTAEQKAALKALDVRLDAAEGIAAQVDDADYRTEAVRQIKELKDRRGALEKSFDQASYEALMHSVISRYQVIALWLKEPPLPPPQPNTLTPGEEAAGWRLLFDGKSLAGWRGYRSQTVPQSWRVEDGSLLSRRARGDQRCTAHAR